VTSKTSPRLPPEAVAPEQPPPSGQSARRWWILAVVGLAQLMVVLDGTIVNIALPSAQRDLGFSDSNRQWIVTAYALAFGSLLLLGGRLADLFGRKLVFLVGVVGFAGASALAGASSSFGQGRPVRRADPRAEEHEQPEPRPPRLEHLPHPSAVHGAQRWLEVHPRTAQGGHRRHTDDLS
jgi:MFS family permease